MHASLLATLYNAHFDTKGTPWTADDLIGKTDRQRRINETLMSRISARVAAKNAEDTGNEDMLPEVVRELAKNRKVN
jgi:hypothetical protein